MCPLNSVGKHSSTPNVPDPHDDTFYFEQHRHAYTIRAHRFE